MALILNPLFVSLGRDELSKVGVGNTSAGHPTLLEEGHKTFSYGPLRKCIPVVLHNILGANVLKMANPFITLA